MSSCRRVFFWKDIWLGLRPLSDSVNEELDGSLMEKKVADYWEEGLGWKWSELHQHIPATQMLLLASTVLRPEDDLMDTMG